MGVSWYSQAEVVTIEPEKVKELILQIANEEDTSPVCNLEIQGNSIFFDSDGYGCFGVEWENYADNLLFERLFEQYTGALICFEAVSQCQQQGYFFTSTWIKPESEVDWDDEETFYKHSRVLWMQGDISEMPDEGNFNEADIWQISFDYLEKNQDNMPNLYAAYLKTQYEAFDNWAISGDGNKAISYEVAQKIGELYSDDEDAVLEDCLENMRQWNSYPIDAENACLEFELPENFPKLSSL